MRCRAGLDHPATASDPSRASYQEAENQTLLTTPTAEGFIPHYVPELADRTPADFPLCARSRLPACSSLCGGTG